MDKMREKPVEERRKLLLTSTIFFGVIITIFGLWNISNNLVALGGNNNMPADLASSAPSGNKTDVPSLFSSLSDNIAGVWSAAKSELQNLNDKLGTTTAQDEK